MNVSHVLAASCLSIAGLAHAQTAPADPLSTHHAQAGAAPAAAMVDGEVRKVDREQGKVTLRHGPIANLDMPGMTMVFKVADPRLLDGLEEGDKVRFAAEKAHGAIMVTAMEAAK